MSDNGQEQPFAIFQKQKLNVCLTDSKNRRDEGATLINVRVHGIFSRSHFRTLEKL
jgi:hypothetical protein